jgi:hypothetical protein
MLLLGRATGAYAGNISFTHAIFKRVQGAYVAGFGTTDGGHFDNANPMGGFCPALSRPSQRHPEQARRQRRRHGAAWSLATGADQHPRRQPAPANVQAVAWAAQLDPGQRAGRPSMWSVMPPPEPAGPACRMAGRRSALLLRDAALALRALRGAVRASRLRVGARDHTEAVPRRRDPAPDHAGRANWSRRPRSWRGCAAIAWATSRWSTPRTIG